jgi:hypothetical protein
MIMLTISRGVQVRERADLRDTPKYLGKILARSGGEMRPLVYVRRRFVLLRASDTRMRVPEA